MVSASYVICGEMPGQMKVSAERNLRGLTRRIFAGYVGDTEKSDHRIRLRHIDRAIRGNDSRNASWTDAHLIALLDYCAIVRLQPLRRVHFFDLNPAVNIDELGLRPFDSHGNGFSVSVRVADFVIGKKNDEKENHNSRNGVND